MKKIPILFAVAMACGAVLAQAPSGTTRPPQELNPNSSGGQAQTKGAMNNDAKTGGMSASAGTTAGQTTAMGNKGMDLNGDGMISRTEWNAYHGKSWSSMKPNKQGMVPWADVQTTMGIQGGTPK
ncbi:MAG: hypothetical protein K0S57_1700 [Ramlibacter sp.]|jgi:hypothetical protein|nr:hypothetical protein [Ramlibacter sp.]